MTLERNRKGCRPLKTTFKRRDLREEDVGEETSRGGGEGEANSRAVYDGKRMSDLT